MKKLLSLLLLFLALQVQAQSVYKNGDTTYYPKQTESYSPIRQVGFAVVTPTNYTPAKKYKTYVIIHGNGELWDARLTDLRNLLLGYGNPRQYAFPPGDILPAVNDTQCIAVFPNWKNGMSPDDVNFVLNETIKGFSVDESKIVLAGFSAGGGVVSRYISSSKANADRLAFAVLAASVNSISNYSVIKEARLPVILITAETDNKVSSQNSVNIYNGILNTGTDIKPFLIKVPGTGHGGLNEIFRYKHSSVPQNLYSFLSKVTNDAPLSYPASSTTIPTPEPEKPIGTPIIVREDVPAVSTTGTVSLLACKSTGFDAFTWTVISVPKSASLWAPYISGAGFCQAAAKFTIEGAYGIKATACKGSTCVSDTLYVTYQKSTVPVPVTPVTYDSNTGYLVLSDGTRLKATATIDWTSKKVTVKGEDGVTYSL